MDNRIVLWCGLLAGLWAGCPRSLVADSSPRLTDLFADRPAASLVRRLEAGPAVATGAAGLSVAQKCRPLDGPGIAVLDTTVANGAAQPATLGDVTLADWSFRLRDDQDQGYRNLTYRNDVWYGSTYWTGPDWTRVGKDWHHPGENTPSVRRFTCPRDGHVTITGRVYKAHVSPSDGVRLAVRHGNRTVWQAGG